MAGKIGFKTGNQIWRHQDFKKLPLFDWTFFSREPKT
jgi:hypothetical protein